ncbi:MAG: hypothetical protein IT238_03325 [Bacteroidia bacterium]|nr:hypothetical protein [Bacteroidia bacterium]MCZ2249059.1 hypothetical protein [Bacteroidia bacterium]
MTEEEKKGLQDFMQTFLQLQAEAQSAYMVQDVKKINFYANALNKFGTTQLQDQLGAAYQKKPDNEIASFYENEDTHCSAPIIFMIKKYHYLQYKEIYRIYVSAINPVKMSFSKCYFVINLKGNFLIISQYAFNENRKKPSHPEWECCGGEDIYLSRLGKAINVIRFQAPHDNAEQMKEYQY